MPLFGSFGGSGDEIQSQFTQLAIYTYFHLMPRFKENKEKLNKVKTQQFNAITQKLEIFKNSDFKLYSQNDLPKNLDQIYELYLSEPITDYDKTKYLDSYTIPLFKTGLSIKELNIINKDAMEKPLALLMLSKKIQYILNNILNICSDFRLNKICKEKEFKDDLQVAKDKYSDLYNKVEKDIAISWIEAIEKEPRFAANPDILKLNTLGITDLRLKNLNSYKHLLTGGKKYTRVKKRKNKLHRTRKRN
jgi:hypothetical protein